MRTRHFPLLAAAAIALAGLASTVTPAGAAPVPPVANVASDDDQARIDAMSPAVPGMNPARTHIFAQRGYATSGGNGDLVYGGGDLLPEAHL